MVVSRKRQVFNGVVLAILIIFFVFVGFIVYKLVEMENAVRTAF